MFRENKKLIYVFLALIGVILALQYLLPEPTDWNRNYLAKNKSPFGCYAIRHLLNQAYSENVSVNNQTLYNFNALPKKNTSFLIVNDKAELNKNDVEALYSFLGQGNTVFIAAGNFYGPLNDSLHLRVSAGFDFIFAGIDSLIKKPGAKLSFYDPGLRAKTFNYSRLAVTPYFSGFDSTRFKVLACIDENKPCLLKGRVNSGTIYLMSMPDVFSNYFVAGHANREAAYACLSLIANTNLVWDEHYKTFNADSRSPLKFIFESDALYAAYLLLLLGIILYMIFEGRRRQRIIPAITPLANTTLDFVNVISHVYYDPKNHKSIAQERIKYFYEIVRRKFRLDTAQPDAGFYRQLHELSGMEEKKLKQLFAYCESMLQAAAITEYELLELNRQIENFNKNSLR